MPPIEIDNPSDPRLSDYLSVRERQLHEAFAEHAPGRAGGDPFAPFGKFMAEGEVVFERLVGSPFPILSVLCTRTRVSTIAPLLARLAASVPVYVVPPNVLDSVIGFHLHRGLMAIAARTRPHAAADLLTSLHAPGVSRTVVVLEDLTNHDNIGATFRNAAALGAEAILLSPSCADPLYRKAIRVSVGHALRLPFARLGPMPDSLSTLTTHGYQTLALTPNQPAIDLRQFTPQPSPDGALRLALIAGSEGPGLTPQTTAAAHTRLCIPMSREVDSLNVSVATAVALEHLRWLRIRASTGDRGA